jgi:hypothetical protein
MQGTVILKSYWSEFIRVAQSFLTWWLSTLGGLLPAGMRQPLSRVDQSIIATVSQSQIMMAISGQDKLLADLERIKGDFRLRWDEEGLQAALQWPSPTFLEFISEWGFWQNLSLPKMDERDAHKVLDLQLSQHSPTKLEAVRYAYKFDAAEDRTKAELVLVKRAQVDRIIQQFLDCGLQVGGATIRSRTEDFAFDIRPDLTSKLRNRDMFRRIAIALVPLVALSLSFGILNSRLQAQHLEIDQKIGAARAKAETIQAKRSVLAKEQERTKLIATLFEQQSVPYLIEVFSEIIPKGSWVREFQFQQDHLSLVGQSDDLSLLVEKLEGSDLVAKVNVTSSRPVSGNNRAEFVLDLKLRSGGGE